MHLVLVHGYLLQGTGSNIYVVNIAKTWKKQGHAVTVVCQDPNANSLPFVDEFIGENDFLPDEPPAAGKMRVVVPDIKRLLPVYVFDKYDGYTVKTIPDMTSEEIEQHINLTAERLRKVCMQNVDRVLANHVLLSPVITARATKGLDVPYNVKIHGSAVEYTLVPNPGLMKYAIEGLRGARHIFTGTQYVKQRASEVFADYSAEMELEKKLKIVPPGMDPDIFRLPDDFQSHQERFLTKVDLAIKKNGRGRKDISIPAADQHTIKDYNNILHQLGQTYDQRIVDADLKERWPMLSESEPLIVYFGKFLPAKGVGELVLTIPQILKKIPQARFLLIGFGSYREHLEGIVQSFYTGNIDECKKCALAGDFTEGVDFEKWFRQLSRREMDRITITGFLDHEMLKEILPLADICIVPSKWPEAFGMVAVEAMAAGVLPICNYYAGLRDVVDAAAEDMPEIRGIISMDRDNFINLLPGKIESALDFLYPDGFSDRQRKEQIASELRSISVKKFSWDGICRKLLD